MNHSKIEAIKKRWERFKTLEWYKLEKEITVNEGFLDSTTALVFYLTFKEGLSPKEVNYYFDKTETKKQFIREQ